LGSLPIFINTCLLLLYTGILKRAAIIATGCMGWTKSGGGERSEHGMSEEACSFTRRRGGAAALNPNQIELAPAQIESLALGLNFPIHPFYFPLCIEVCSSQNYFRWVPTHAFLLFLVESEHIFFQFGCSSMLYVKLPYCCARARQLVAHKTHRFSKFTKLLLGEEMRNYKTLDIRPPWSLAGHAADGPCIFLTGKQCHHSSLNQFWFHQLPRTCWI